VDSALFFFAHGKSCSSSGPLFASANRLLLPSATTTARRERCVSGVVLVGDRQAGETTIAIPGYGPEQATSANLKA
jgi:hypothetical protein